MKTIGLLGGMSFESTVEYYRIINEEVRRRLGGVHSARIVMSSVDFADIEALQAAGSWDEAGALLAAHARRLETAGADCMVLCTNTMHKVIGTIEADIDIPVIHIGDATAAAVKTKGIKRIGLLGTAFTMSQSFYRDRIASHGIDVIVPEAQDQETVHQIIYEELVQGNVRDESRQRYQDVIGRLQAEGAQAVILGCTEIELLISQADSPIPVFPTTQIHAISAVDWAFNER
ncbi:MAG: aspartate/glutamate racemase family protein [Actinomycetaceae bacterium]|nr:aspartate/glutamate racemase family protein [Actinomycetaceae bacterium]